MFASDRSVCSRQPSRQWSVSAPFFSHWTTCSGLMKLRSLSATTSCAPQTPRGCRSRSWRCLDPTRSLERSLKRCTVCSPDPSECERSTSARSPATPAFGWLGRSIPRSTLAAAALWERAEGSPFWLEMLVATTDGRSDLESQIGLRLQGAGSDPSALLALITLAGRPLTAREAADLLGWPPGRTEAAAGLLADRGLGVRAGDSLRVTHDLIREIADRQIPEAERRDTHRRIAAWL